MRFMVSRDGAGRRVVHAVPDPEIGVAYCGLITGGERLVDGRNAVVETLPDAISVCRASGARFCAHCYRAMARIAKEREQ